MYQFIRKQHINTDLENCWAFFSNPANLAAITPDSVRFRVLTKQSPKIYEGLMIAYTIAPLLAIPLKWVTEIKYVHDREFFVDEQRQGPYSMWHHEHHFEQTADGVLMTDTVSYRLPFGFIGRFAHWLFVRKQIEGIFEYRRKKIEELFSQ